MKYKTKLSKNQSFSISTIRAIATLSIVLCHILQGVNNVLAWWFNVGVQIFLCMSGFLLGNSKIDKTSDYLNKRFKKIFIPYYIFMVCMIGLYQLKGIVVSKKSIAVYALGVQGLKYKYQFILPGIEHLWFISIILICYILALCLDKFRNNVDSYTEIQFYTQLIKIFIIIQTLILFSSDLEVSYSAWIGAFIFGYLISYRYSFIIPKKLIKLIGILLCITIPIRIYYQYFKTINNETLVYIFNNLYIPWTHMILGCFLFMLMYNLFSKIYGKYKLCKFIKIIDKYSYEIYITHQIFILGPFSLLYFTNNISLNIIIIIIFIWISSYILHNISNYVKSKLS